MALERHEGFYLKAKLKREAVKSKTISKKPKKPTKRKAKNNIDKKIATTRMVARRRSYTNKVRKLTEKQPLHTLPGIEKRSFRGFEVDHKISIFYGFKHGIPAEAIADISNLQVISHNENEKKGRKPIGQMNIFMVTTK